MMCDPNAEGLEGHLGRKGWSKKEEKDFVAYSLYFASTYVFELICERNGASFVAGINRIFPEFEGTAHYMVEISKFAAQTPMDALSRCNQEFELYLKAQQQELEILGDAVSRFKGTLSM